MAFCRVCGSVFQWGFCEGQWVPLEPMATHDDLDRSYVDEDGELRADHRDRHTGGRSVNVQRLENKVRAEDVEPADDDVVETVGEVQDALADEKGWFAKMRSK